MGGSFYPAVLQRAARREGAAFHVDEVGHAPLRLHLLRGPQRRSRKSLGQADSRNLHFFFKKLLTKRPVLVIVHFAVGL
ncbi:MAG: hypothetical protein BCS36_12800 [Desulfovibrio sp. MES5]|nr:MAG: hypothetical protein BCS36_12800 [Desulfovibrio sp. MES5]